MGVPHNKPCWRQTPMCRYLIGGVISGKRKINRKGEKLKSRWVGSCAGYLTGTLKIYPSDTWARHEE